MKNNTKKETRLKDKLISKGKWLLIFASGGYTAVAIFLTLQSSSKEVWPFPYPWAGVQLGGMVTLGLALLFLSMLDNKKNM